MSSVQPGGIGNYASTWQKALKTDEPCKDLVFTHLGEAPFMPGALDNDSLTLIYAFSRIFGAKFKRFEDHIHYGRAIIEVFGPFVPDSWCLDQASARLAFIETMNWAGNIRARYPAYDPNKIQEAVTAVDQTYVADANGNYLTTTYAECLILLRIYAKLLDVRPDSVALTMLVNVVVSLAKKGTVSERFMNKITNGLRDDLNRADVTLSDTLVATVWRFLSPMINENNVQSIIQQWLGFLPDQALRIRLTLQQIPGEGLVALTTTLKAMKAFPDFYWERVSVLAPGEMGAVVAGATAYRNNPFVGYKKDISTFASTRMRGFSYCGMQLCVRLLGMTTLERARTFNVHPVGELQLKRLVDDYINDRAGRDLTAVTRSQNITDLIAIAGQCDV